MKRILVTGAGGFWGGHLIRHLQSRNYAVTAAYHHPPRTVPKGLSILSLDVCEPSEVQKAVRKLKPDAICHFAGQSSLSRAWEKRDHTFRLNTLSVVSFLESIRKFSPQTRFLLASSIHVFGTSFSSRTRALTEKDPPRPENPYGASKRLAELICLDFYGRCATDCVIIRPVNCIGAHLSPDFVFSDWSRQIVACENRGQGELRVGNLEVLRDFLHIQDAVEACEILLKRGRAGEIYNLSSEKISPLKRYAEFLIHAASVPVKIRTDHRRIRKAEPHATKVSSAKLRALGWKPQKTALEGLGDLLNEWRTKLS